METIKRILFVCTANTCRSPMAEFMLKKLIKENEDFNFKNWKISSAGVSAVKGAGANDKAKSVMAEVEIDLTDHKSHNINEIELAKKDLIITMTRRHSRALILSHPDLADKIFTLKELSKKEEKDSQDITNPFGLSEAVYRETRDEIIKNLKILLKELKNFDFKEKD